jgi:hypothetical protein
MKPVRPFLLWLLLFFMLLLSLGGFYGGIVFLLDPSGVLMQMDPAVLPLLPVPDYTLPGLFLLLVMGIAPAVLLYGLLKTPEWGWTKPFVGWSGRHWSWTGTFYLGVVLALWLIVEGWLIGFSAPVQFVTAFISLAILLVTLTPPVRRCYQL